MAGKHMDPCPVPAGPLLAEVPQSCRHVLVDPDAGVDGDLVAEATEHHREVGVLAVHPRDEPADEASGLSPEGGESTGDAVDGVHPLQSNPGESKADQAFEEPAPAVE